MYLALKQYDDMLSQADYWPLARQREGQDSVIRFSKRFLSIATEEDAAEFLEQDFPLSDNIHLRISMEVINDRMMILSAVQVRLDARNHKPRTTSSPALPSEQ